MLREPPDNKSNFHHSMASHSIIYQMCYLKGKEDKNLMYKGIYYDNFYVKHILMNFVDQNDSINIKIFN